VLAFPEVRPASLAIIKDQHTERNRFVPAPWLDIIAHMRWVHSDPRVTEWLGGIEPLWTRLDPRGLLALCESPERSGAAVRLASDFSKEEIALSWMATNVMRLVRFAAAASGLKLTATGNLARSVVTDLRNALEWQDDRVAMTFEVSKVVNEADLSPLHFLRLTAQEAGLLRKLRGKLIVTKHGKALLDHHSPALLATLFHAAFWRLNLGYFDRAAHPSWPQSHIGIVLWSLASAARNWDPGNRLVRLCTVPTSEIIAFPALVRAAFHWRVLDPLVQFGLMERRERATSPAFREYEFRKSPLFDRFLSFRLP
jgi:hypothetical protein